MRLHRVLRQVQLAHHAALQGAHENRGLYRLRPQTDVNARAGRPTEEPVSHSVIQRRRLLCKLASLVVSNPWYRIPGIEINQTVYADKVEYPQLMNICIYSVVSKHTVPLYWLVEIYIPKSRMVVSNIWYRNR